MDRYNLSRIGQFHKLLDDCRPEIQRISKSNLVKVKQCNKKEPYFNKTGLPKVNPVYLDLIPIKMGKLLCKSFRIHLPN